MGIITRAINKANLNPQLEGVTSTAVMQDLVPLMYTAMGYFGYQPPQTFYQLVNSLSSWEFIVDDKISRTVASLPIKIRAMQKKSSRKFLTASEAIYHKTSMQKMNRIKRHYYLKDAGLDVVEITDHPFYDLMRTPNPIDVRFTFMYATAMRIELSGMCGWYKVRGKNGLPMEIWPLPLTWTGELKPVPDTKTIIAGYLYMDGNIRETFRLDEILFFKLPHLKGPWEGMSAIKSQMYPYSIDDQQQKQVYNIFKNQAMFGNVFSTDKDLQTQQISDIHAQLQATYQGAKNAGKALVLHSGLKQDKGLQTSFRDLMLDVVNENVRDKMLSSHSISPSNVGMTKSSNRANMESAQESFYTDCITPRLMLIEEHIEQKLLTEYDDGFTCDFELPTFEDANEKRQQEDSDVKNMVMMPNEVRLARGLQSDPTIDGVWFVPNTMVALKDGKVDEALSPPKPVPVPFVGQPKPGGEVPPVKPGQEPKEPAQEPSTSPKEPAKAIKAFAPGTWTKERKATQWKAMDKRVTEKYEPIIKKAVQKHFKEQRAFVLKSVESEFKILSGVLNGMGPNKRKSWVAENKDKVQKANIDKADWTAKLKSDLKPAIKEVVRKAGEFYADTLADHGYADEEFTFNLGDPDVKQWMGDKIEDTATQATQTTYDAIADALKEGYGDGETVAKLAERINNIFDNADQARSNNIARTESTSANNKADIESVRQADLEDTLEKFWIDQQDGNVRDTHAQAGADYSSDSPIGVDDEFEVGDDKMDAPGDGSSADENCNCFPGDMLFYSPNAERYYKSLFDGKIITIKLADGKNLTGTPNHPILTDRGFTPLHLLKKGDSIISANRSDWESLGNFDIQNRPSAFQEKFNSSHVFGTRMRVSGTIVNFYGDTPDGDVDIININGELLNRVKPSGNKPGKHFRLTHTNFKNRLLFGNSHLDSVGMPDFDRKVFDCRMGGRRKSLPALFGGLTHSQEHTFTSIALDNAELIESQNNRFPICVVKKGKALDRHPTHVSGKQIVRHNIGAVDSCSMQSFKMNSSLNGAFGHSISLAQVRNALSCQVSFSKIIDIHESSYRGNVYTAQTHTGIYICNGVVVKNCRCSLGWTEKKEK